ncbi:flagellar protein, FliL [Methanosphaera sp.]
MKTNNLIILGVIAVALIAILLFVGFGTQSTETNNTTNNTTINITLNDSNATENQTTKTTTKKQSTTKSKSDSPDIVSDSVKYNYQVDDGSYYREVEYSDGNFRQYDSKGRIIGSSYDNDKVYGPSME